MLEKYFRIILCSMLAVCCLIGGLNAQDEKLISSKKLLKDFEELREAVGAHPDPFTHISEADFNARYEAIKATLNEPHTQLDFYKKAASLIALIRDGHSSVNFPSYWLLQQRKKVGAFPYELYLTNDDKLYVIKNFNEGPIPLRAEIVKINGITVDSFLKAVDPYISYELKHFRNTIIDGSFETCLYTVFGHADNTSLTYFSVDTTTVTVPNMPYKEWKRFQKDNREERELKIAKGEPYAYEKLADGVGVIRVYAFFASDLKAYELFLLKTFRRIKQDNIHSLIIDIRGNFGGWPKISSLLFHYISDTYFKTMAQSSLKISEAYRMNLFERMPFLRNPGFHIPERRHYINIDAVIRNEIGSYVNEAAFFNEEPITKDHEFKGDCYLLMNRDSYSAASSFASTFQCYRMGVIIGEETGGTKIFRANSMSQKLNRTNISFRISTTKLFTTCYDEEFQGVLPNLEYKPSPLELTSDLDTHLYYALGVIKRIQRKRAKE